MNYAEREWYPWQILNMENNFSNNERHAIIVLNTVILWKPEFLIPLWSKAILRITVDGGTNRWFKWLKENNINADSIENPDFVTGDMDSIDESILVDIEEKNFSTIIATTDQNETDFTKSLRELRKICELRNTMIENVIVISDTSGRLDQIMANINTLYKAKLSYPNLNIFQLANDSLSWLLTKGEHKIHVPDVLHTNKKWCALIPIGETCDHITTTGLKWNLVDRTMKFGELVSSSNTYSDQPFVTIKTEKTLLWSMGLCHIPNYISDRSANQGK